MIKTVGSICSGIEAASVAWNKYAVNFVWFSEIADFPSRVLEYHYPDIPNIGDMNNLPYLIAERRIEAPDLLCGGTPCQAFSFAGWKNGLSDARGNLTLKFVDIVEANDKVREKQGLSPSIIFWENVEGVLSDKTNAFGCFISSLAGLQEALSLKGNKWPAAGLLRGPKRNVCWRVLDSKFFGLPQQRRRLYLLAGGKDFSPESVLFESISNEELKSYPEFPLSFHKGNSDFEVFRAYTDCLYSAYGTKWNGNAAAYNGSLFIVQNGRIRRFSTIECERLMGFPDYYTNIPKAKKTNRYQALGNSWAVPVVRWVGERLFTGDNNKIVFNDADLDIDSRTITQKEGFQFYNFGNKIIENGDSFINCTYQPADCSFDSLYSIVDEDAPEDIYISPVGCYGIIRRKNERNLRINPHLEDILYKISSTMEPEEIERKSRIQHRGKHSLKISNQNNAFTDAQGWLL